MREYKRENPMFSLCGLNCGLCPRHQCEGASRCPGCGGENFHLQHPACAVITCSQKHGGVEYCFLCEDYPCERYAKIGGADSFITYRNVKRDMEKARDMGIGRYQAELDEKIAFLEHLLLHYNDGRKKNFYCLAVNLLALADLKRIKEAIGKDISKEPISEKDKIAKITSLFQETAREKNIDLTLRK